MVNPVGREDYLFKDSYRDFLCPLLRSEPIWAGLLDWAISAVWLELGNGDIVQAAGVAVVNGGQSLLPIFALAFVLETSGLVALLSGKTRDYVASRIR